jgi:hypothetical protein
MSLRYILMLKDVCDNEYQLVRPICIRSRVKLIRNDHKEMKELRTFFYFIWHEGNAILRIDEKTPVQQVRTSYLIPTCTLTAFPEKAKQMKAFWSV